MVVFLKNERKMWRRPSWVRNAGLRIEDPPSTGRPRWGVELTRALTLSLRELTQEVLVRPSEQVFPQSGGAAGDVLPASSFRDVEPNKLVIALH